MNHTENAARQAELRAKMAQIEADMAAIHANADRRSLNPGELQQWENLRRGLENRQAELKPLRDESEAHLRDLVARGSADWGDAGVRNLNSGHT